MRDCLDSCPAPPVRVPDDAVTRSASPRLRAYAALAAIGADRGARRGPPGARSARDAVRAARRASRSPAAPLALDGDAAARPRARRSRESRLRATVAVVNRGAPARVERPPADDRAAANRPDADRRSGSRAASGVSSTFELAVGAGACTTSVPRSSARATGSARSTLDGPLGEACRAARLRRRRPAAQARRAAADPAGPGQPGLPRARRGHRVRRSPSARAGRPRPQHQLARDVAPPRPVRQRAASGAQRRRRPVPRHVRRGRARGGGHTRRGGRTPPPRSPPPTYRAATESRS